MMKNHKKRNKAIFRFYAELNDFLPKNKRQITFDYHFHLNPAVKDAIEAMGIPHPEVDLILVNDVSVGFDYHLQNGDRIAVYPEFELYNISEVSRLRPEPLRVPRFILDVNLGGLAKKLRMLGFDVTYQNNFTDQLIVKLATSGKRTILTRDQGLLKIKKVDRGYWIRQTDVEKQVIEVVQKYDLLSLIKPFSRCMNCNGAITKIAKAEISELLKPRTKSSFNEFYRCTGCEKVYWKGSHYGKMIKFIEKVKKVCKF